MSDATPLGDMLSRLFATIDARRDADPESSYTASLLAAGVEKCAKKFGEEAVEVVLASVSGDRAALAEETADALYHLMTLLAAAGVEPADVAAVLSRREGVSGHDEKASRKH